MTERANAFAYEWISENISLGPYAPDPSKHPDASSLVEQLVADARTKGISRQELEDDLGDLHKAVSGAMKSITDDEVERLSRKSD